MGFFCQPWLLKDFVASTKEVKDSLSDIEVILSIPEGSTYTQAKYDIVKRVVDAMQLINPECFGAYLEERSLRDKRKALCDYVVDGDNELSFFKELSQDPGVSYLLH